MLKQKLVFREAVGFGDHLICDELDLYVAFCQDFRKVYGLKDAESIEFSRKPSEGATAIRIKFDAERILANIMEHPTILLSLSQMTLVFGYSLPERDRIVTIYVKQLT